MSSKSEKSLNSLDAFLKTMSGQNGGKTNSENEIEAEILSLEGILDREYKVPDLPPEFNFPEIEVEPVGAILEVFEIADWFCRYYDRKLALLKGQLGEKDVQPFNLRVYRSLRNNQNITLADKNLFEHRVCGCLDDFAGSKQPPLISGRYLESSDRKELSLNFAILSACFDEFILRSRYSKKGAELHPFDQEILDAFYSPDYRRQQLKTQLETLKRRERVSLEPGYRRTAQKLVASLIKFIDDAEQRIPAAKDENSRMTMIFDCSEIKLYLQQLRETLNCTKITAGFHRDWRDNVFNSIDSCIHNQGSQRLASYHYSSDRGTYLLFFRPVTCDKMGACFESLQDKTLAPSAEAILMEAQENEKKGLVVEGVIFDDYFFGLQPKDGTTISQFITACIDWFGENRYDDLFLNIREVTNEKELPTLYYLEDVCKSRGIGFGFRSVPSPKDKSLTWFVTDKNYQAYRLSSHPYLRKSSSSLEKKIYTHLWGDLLEDGGISDCQGDRARVVRLPKLEERIKKMEIPTPAVEEQYPRGVSVAGVDNVDSVGSIAGVDSVEGPSGANKAEEPIKEEKPIKKYPLFKQILLGLVAIGMLGYGGYQLYKREAEISKYWWCKLKDEMLYCADSLLCLERADNIFYAVCEDVKRLNFQLDKVKYLRPVDLSRGGIGPGRGVKVEVDGEIYNLAFNEGHYQLAFEQYFREKSKRLFKPLEEKLEKKKTFPKSEKLVRVKLVKDGDEIVLDNADEVRLMCINAPEINEYHGQEAQKYLTQLIVGREVKLMEDSQTKTDHFGRTLRYVYLGKAFIQEDLVKNGYVAVHGEKFGVETDLCGDLREAQNHARKNKLGIWGEEEQKGLARFVCQHDFLNCNDFQSCDEVEEYYDGCGGQVHDIHLLDGKKGGVPGVPCERLCLLSSYQQSKGKTEIPNVQKFKSLLQEFKDSRKSWEDRGLEIKRIRLLEDYIRENEKAKKILVKIIDQWAQHPCNLREVPSAVLEQYALAKGQLEAKGDFFKLHYKNYGCHLVCEVAKGRANCRTFLESPPY